MLRNHVPPACVLNTCVVLLRQKYVLEYMPARPDMLQIETPRFRHVLPGRSPTGCFLFGASAREDSRHAVVSLVTGVLENRPVRLCHCQLGGPRRCIPARIVDCELIQQSISGCACEPLNQSESAGIWSGRRPRGPAHTWLEDEVAEIRGGHHQRVLFPSAARIPQPLPDAVCKMWTPIQRHDSGAMNHLVVQHHVSGTLKNLEVLILPAARCHWRSRVESQEATRKGPSRAKILDEAARRRSVELDSFASLFLFRIPPLRLRRQRGDLSI